MVFFNPARRDAGSKPATGLGAGESDGRGEVVEDEDLREERKEAGSKPAIGLGAGESDGRGEVVDDEDLREERKEAGSKPAIGFTGAAEVAGPEDNRFRAAAGSNTGSIGGLPGI